MSVLIVAKFHGDTAKFRQTLLERAEDLIKFGELSRTAGAIHHRFGVGDFSTLCYLTVDPFTGVVVYACAGHPYPLLLTHGEAPRYLEGGRSLPLGVAPDASGLVDHERIGDEWERTGGGISVVEALFADLAG